MTDIDLTDAIRAARVVAAQDTEFVPSWGHDGIYAGTLPAIVAAAATHVEAQVRAQIAADILNDAKPDDDRRNALWGLARAAKIARGDS